MFMLVGCSIISSIDIICCCIWCIFNVGQFLWSLYWFVLVNIPYSVHIITKRFFSLFMTLLLGVRAKSKQCSVHCLSLSLTWTLVLVLLVPLASWWGLCRILIVMEEATSLQLLSSFWLLVCFGLTQTQGPKLCQRWIVCLLTCSSFIVPSNSHLPVLFKILFLNHWICTFFPISQWCCTIVYIVCTELFTHLIEPCVPLFNWHQTTSKQPRQLWILKSLNNSPKAAAQVIRGSACLFLFIPYLHRLTPPPQLSNMRWSRTSVETSAMFSCTDTEGWDFFNWGNNPYYLETWFLYVVLPLERTQ